MVAPATSSVVLAPFPFSDLSQAKLRPAVILTVPETAHRIAHPTAFGISLKTP